MGAWPQIFQKRKNPSLRLFCFPYAGGLAQVFSTWGQALPPHVEVVAMQPPGRWNRASDAPLLTLTGMVDSAMPEMRSLLDLPFAFFGYSMGCLVAFEISRKLREEGGPQPVCFFAAASVAPQLHLSAPRLHHLTDENFMQAIIERYGPFPDSVRLEPEILAAALRVMKNDFAAFESYRYMDSPALNVPIHILRGTEDRIVTAEAASGWQIQTSAGSDITDFDGGHMFIHRQHPGILALIEKKLRNFPL